MNPNLFKTSKPKAKPSTLMPAVDGVNNAGGAAYMMEDKHALAQLALTGCTGTTFYVSAETQVDQMISLARKVEPSYLAKVAVASRNGHMKDAPAILLAVLAHRDAGLFAKVAPAVCDTFKMVANLVQVLRSDKLASGKDRGNLPRPVRRFIARWLNVRPLERLLNDSVGVKPTLKDVIAMVHPKPADQARAVTFGYFLGAKGIETTNAALPKAIRDFEAWKVSRDPSLMGRINFRLLDSVGLTPAEWALIAEGATWTTTRMNLATFARHGVFSGPRGGELTRLVASRLRDEQAVSKSRAFPFQLYMAHEATRTNPAVPEQVRDALHDALDVALGNIPEMPGRTAVIVDVSGSMGSAITGSRGTKDTAVRVVDAAAVIAAAVLRRHPAGHVKIIPVDTSVHATDTGVFSRRDSIMTIAQRLAKYGGGGTNLAAATDYLVNGGETWDQVIVLSDNESWAASPVYGKTTTGWSWRTPMTAGWEKLRARNPKARLFCVDLQPNTHSQVPDGAQYGVYHIGGFSDAIFTYIGEVLAGETTGWVAQVEAIDLDKLPTLDQPASSAQAAKMVNSGFGGETCTADDM